MTLVLCLIVLMPAITFALFSLGWLLGWNPSERTVARITSLCYLTATILSAGLWLNLTLNGKPSFTAFLGLWFHIDSYGFPIILLVDRLSMPLVFLSALLVGVVGVFSVRYLHRDEGFHRFFMLLNLFGFGILLLFCAGSFDLLICGWELVGITSVLLIAFFQHRNEPVSSALKVFAVYRICDIGLLVAVAMMHHYAGSAVYSKLFPSSWPLVAGVLKDQEATIVGALLLFAALGKSAQVPFSGWLPRAMEGPTPSSAIFYGALSVHAGAYLLLRAEPIIATSPLIAKAIIIIGILTAIHGTMVGRSCADAKTSLAYASLTQLGIIFVEIGIGWSWLALIQICAHSVTRTLQFLRTPSMLHDHHRLHAAAGGHLAKTGNHYERFLSEGLQRWLYRLAIERGLLDTLLERLVVNPVLTLAVWLHRLETSARQKRTSIPTLRRM